MLFPMFFGCVHALLCDNLLLQSLCLAVLELLYLLLRVVGFSQRLAQKKMKVTLAFVGSALRILFIFSFYVYDSNPLNIFNAIHKELVLIYLANWGVEVCFDLIEFLYEAVSNILKSG